MDKDELIGERISRLAASGEDLAGLYDLITKNPDIACKKDMLALLKMIKRPDDRSELATLMEDLAIYLMFDNLDDPDETKMDNIMRWAKGVPDDGRIAKQIKQRVKDVEHPDTNMTERELYQFLHLKLQAYKTR